MYTRKVLQRLVVARASSRPPPGACGLASMAARKGTITTTTEGVTAAAAGSDTQSTAHTSSPPLATPITFPYPEDDHKVMKQRLRKKKEAVVAAATVTATVTATSASAPPHTHTHTHNHTHTHTHPHQAPPAAAADVMVTNSATHKTQSFYRRQLPTTHCIPFSSQEGRRMFQQALAGGGMESFFPLSEQFKTQDDPAFCGLGALTMVLNALAIDPGRTWKGPWRWFDESMLECCEPLEVVRARGICISKLDCLARCNGATTRLKYGDATSLAEFRTDIERITSHPHIHGHEELMILGYNRQILGQTGMGHFSPVGGYHKGQDMVLIMDVARFKYPPHWVSVPLLWDAMQTVDPETQKSRGYLMVGKGLVSESLLFTIDKQRYREFEDLAGWLREASLRLPPLMEEEMAVGLGLGGGGSSIDSAAIDHERLLPLFLQSLPESIASMVVTVHDTHCLSYEDKHMKSIDQLLAAIEAHPVYAAISHQHQEQIARFKRACKDKARDACCARKVINEKHVLTIIYISVLEWVCQRQGWSIFRLFPHEVVYTPALQIEVAQLKRKFAAMADDVVAAGGGGGAGVPPTK